MAEAANLLRRAAAEQAQAAPVSLEPDFLSDLFEEIRCVSIGFAEAAYAAPWSIDRRAGDEARGYFVESGKALLAVAGSPEVVLEPGDLVFVPPGYAHRLSSHDAAPAILGQALYHLDRIRARALLRVLPPIVLLKNKGGEMTPVVKPMSDLILSLRAAPELGGVAILRRVAEATVMRSIQHYLKTELTLNPDTVKLGVLRMAPALQAMHRNPEVNWTLSALARRAGMSRTVFAAAFTEAMGEAPGRYLTQIRMTRAEELLQLGGLPLAEVAARVGYGVEAFGRAFKRHSGLSPGRFRRERQETAQADREDI